MRGQDVSFPSPSESNCREAKVYSCQITRAKDREWMRSIVSHSMQVIIMVFRKPTEPGVAGRNGRRRRRYRRKPSWAWQQLIASPFVAVSCFYACETGSTAGLAPVVTTRCIKMAGCGAAAPQTAKFDTTLESVPTRQTAASRAGGAVVLPRPPTHSTVPLYRAVPPTLFLPDLLIHIHSLSTFFPRLLRTSQLRCHRRRVLSPPC